MKIKPLLFVLVILMLIFTIKSIIANYEWGIPFLMPKDKLKKLAIAYSDHDKYLQKQEVTLNSGKHEHIYIWKALCEERRGAMKAVLVFTFTLSSKMDMKDYEKNIRCLINGAHSPDYDKVYIRYADPGFFVFCVFERNLECPENISLQFGNQTVTNQLTVERQYKKNIQQEDKKMSLTLCLPAITKNLETFKPHRLTEYFEYQRLVGVNRIMLAEINGRVYNFTLNEQSRKVIQFYKDEGFLEIFEIPLLDNKRVLYRLSDITKRAQFTYCTVKAALISDYVIVHDFDEAVGFNSNLYKNLPDAISAAVDKNFKYSSFFLKDTPVARLCNFTNDLKNVSDFVLLRSKLFYTERFNPGKVIHSSQTCQISFHHGCTMKRDENLFWKLSKKTRKVSDRNFAKTLDLHKDKGKNMMRIIHNREEFPNKAKAQKLANKLCEQAENLNWIDNLSQNLLNNSLKVLYSLNL